MTAGLRASPATLTPEAGFATFVSGAITPLAKPSPEASLVDLTQAHDLAVYTANDRTGSYLWLAAGGRAAAVEVVATNTFLRQIADGRLEQIEYRGVDGQNLKAWIILPPGYTKGTPCPLVTWVYAGTVMRDTPPRQEGRRD